MTLKIVTIVGARPQFVKAAAFSRVLLTKYQGRADEVLVHTGQHFDWNMSRVFFDQLGIPAPKHNLEISGGAHGSMTGRMLIAIEEVLAAESPDWVLVYGDTNSTLAGAVAAVKMHIPVAHVEAGLRSYNMRMPEEVNRIVTDRVATLLLCPTDGAVANLAREGIVDGVHNVGDVMYDVARVYGDTALQASDALSRLGLERRGFALATCHRAGNTDDPERLKEICGGLADVARDMAVVFAIHPRTRQAIESSGLKPLLGDVRVIEPLPFLDMMALEMSAKVIITDSGGVQKEAYFHRVPCLTLRDETEWVETIDAGWNALVPASREKIAAAVRNVRTPSESPSVYGDGDASSKIIDLMIGHRPR